MAWPTIRRRATPGKAKAPADAEGLGAAQEARPSFSRRLQSMLQNLGSALRGGNDAAAAGLAARAAESELEELLYTADLGPQLVEELLQQLRGLGSGWQQHEVLELWHQTLLRHLTSDVPASDLWPTEWSGLRIVFLIGVNGAGKTTTAAKLAHYYQHHHGKRPLLAAADTFRVAAADQLAVWAERAGVDCIRQQSGADPAAVVYDAVVAAQARTSDLLIVDSGGRLHTNQNLLESLNKMLRAAEKAAGRPVDAVYLVLDATAGQNAVRQASAFQLESGANALILTKVDGNAKGGAVIEIRRALQLPVAFLGTGEQLDDLRRFNAATFAAALLGLEAPRETE